MRTPIQSALWIAIVLALALGGSSQGRADEKGNADARLVVQDGAVWAYSVAFSRDGNRIVTVGGEGAVRLWDTHTGKQIPVRKSHKARVSAVAFAPDSKSFLTGSDDKTARLWNALTGKEIKTFSGHADGVTSVAFTPDGKQVLTGGKDKTAILWDVAACKELHRFMGPTAAVTSVAIAPDGKHVLLGSSDHTAWMLGILSRSMFRIQPLGSPRIKSEKDPPGNHSDAVTAVAFSPDSKRLLTGSADKTVRVWEAETGKVLLTLKNHTKPVSALAFSSDGKSILTGSWDKTVRLWNAMSGREQHVFKGDLSAIHSVAFSPDGKFILASGSRIWLWNRAGTELCQLINCRNGGWAVIDAAGRYDASNGGEVEEVGWVVGSEKIALNQLKDRYYDPGLLAKHLGFNKEPLRDVQLFKTVKLFPDVVVTQKEEEKKQKKPVFDVALTNRGGGIGKVVVLVNDREYSGDARPRGVDDNAPKLDFPLDLSNDPRLIPGQKNRVEVLVYNKDGQLSSRGLVREFDAPGQAATDPPHLYAVVVGVADYKGKDLHLNYAAKDAEDFAAALRLAASRLFGAQQVHVTLLTAAGGEQQPTRANLVKALAGLKTTKPGDLVVVYLAGHGITHSDKDGENWYYLSADAQKADLAAKAGLERVCLSSTELIDLLKLTPARKQVLILDTCHSGAVLPKLAQRRDVPSSQVRALERVKDRTGMHVLAGCAADAVSYEASKYGQGLLTYSLLEGLRGAKLREGEYVDVVDLFSFAADRVPELASDIGGVQRPTVASPRGASFDLGRMTSDDRAKVTLQTPRPIVVHSTLQRDDPPLDTLGLNKRIHARLRDISASGRSAKLAFVDAEDCPDSVRPTGRYKIDGDKVTVDVKLYEGEKERAAFTVNGKASKPDELAGLIVAEIEKELAASGGK